MMKTKLMAIGAMCAGVAFGASSESVVGSTLLLTVPEGENWVSAGAFADGVTEVVKDGLGTAQFTQASALSLIVSNGTARLNSESGAAFASVRVEAGATAILDRDEQISDTGELYLLGTFDMNGHNETLACFGNNCWNASENLSSKLFFDDQSARLVNGGATEVTLTLNGTANRKYKSGDDYDYSYRGSCEETNGKINLAITGGQFCFRAAKDTFKPSSIAFSGNSRFFDNTIPDFYCFKFKRAGESGVSGVAEIMLTYKGKPIDLSAAEVYTDAKVDSVSAITRKIKDGSAMTTISSDAAEYYIRFQLAKPVPVDGYVIVAGQQKSAPLPSEWKVYARVNSYLSSGYVLADSRSGQTTNQDCMPVDSYTFDSPVYPCSALTDYTRYTSSSTASSASFSSLNSSLNLGAWIQNLLMRNDGVLTVCDLSEFTGALISESSAGTFMLDLAGETTHAMPRTSAASNFGNVTIANGGTAPLSLALPDDYAVRVNLADGTETLGVTKSGSGTATMGSYRSEYSGPTDVQAGTLRIQGTLPNGPVSAKYVRFNTLKVSGDKGSGFADNNCFNISMSEFELRDAEGNKVAWPSKVKVSATHGFHSTYKGSNLIDGDYSSRCLVYASEDKKTKSTELDPIVFNLGEEVTFAGYAWWMASTYYWDRTPVKWTIDVSDDGENWVTVHNGAEAYAEPTVGDVTTFAKGPYELGSSSIASDFSCALPAEYRATIGTRDTQVPAVKAQYFMFQPLKTVNRKKGLYSYGWQLCEFSIFRNGTRLDWDGATCAVEVGTLNQNNGSALAKFIDNIRTGDTDSSSTKQNRMFIEEVPSAVVINAGKQVEFDAYGFTSVAANAERTPVSWNLYVSNDKATWTRIDTQADVSGITAVAAYTDYGPWSVTENYPLGADGALNAIGDKSELRISSGASVSLEAPYEKVGSLAGAGSFMFSPLGSTLELGTANNTAAFSGGTYGAGTLVVSGEGSQSFDGADLSAVDALELNGGMLKGTAGFGNGALNLSFGGGALAGTLSDIGELTVSGEVKYALPDGMGENAGVTLKLFENCTLSAEAQTALAAGRAENVPGRMIQRVAVDATSVTLNVARPGMVLSIR